MADEPSTRNTLRVEEWMAESVISVSFDHDDNAYAALTLLKELDSQHQIGVEEAVVVVRDDDGRVIEKDRAAAFALLRGRREHEKAATDAKIEELKAKLHGAR